MFEIQGIGSPVQFCVMDEGMGERYVARQCSYEQSLDFQQILIFHFFTTWKSLIVLYSRVRYFVQKEGLDV